MKHSAALGVATLMILSAIGVGCSAAEAEEEEAESSEALSDTNHPYQPALGTYTKCDGTLIVSKPRRALFNRDDDLGRHSFQFELEETHVLSHGVPAGSIPSPPPTVHKKHKGRAEIFRTGDGKLTGIYRNHGTTFACNFDMSLDVRNEIRVTQTGDCLSLEKDADGPTAPPYGYAAEFAGTYRLSGDTGRCDRPGSR